MLDPRSQVGGWSRCPNLVSRTVINKMSLAYFQRARLVFAAMRYYVRYTTIVRNQGQGICIEWRQSPEAPTRIMRWGHIGKPISRLVVCIAVVFAVTAALYAVPLDRRPLTSALSFL